ncbi:hypothetical protein A2966_02830 [Candidatus Roizmanbacteria bacterium RIFCSPLOWO2_01_FULL_41_22]|uniref:DegT/DnrJ/EryC1/StrS aminotransferase n=1 Tax=Candidatus Roizmanbacteria bacterium RIFCSPLOWO2_01_FULL_41_22 TaxID=1802067 RepID=A0A1F7J5Y1_9BACT|nr:MAG: hypothetical protein A2966_02830 [Candidatus Roizmanbacteria bacterium RIFCSPLOWO2_01_FULL_41_22]
MIFTDFAPNEELDDSLLAIKLIFQPWKWKKGKATELTKKLLERKFFPYHCFHFFLSGRAALYYVLKALRLPADSEILVQAFTCEAVVLPILANNLHVAYVDIEESTFSMDPKDLQQKINSNSKVMILQHTFGIMPQRDKILEIARNNKILVIEDLAHGFDAHTLRHDKYKTIKLLSFGRSKAFSSVFGGALAVSDVALNQKLKKMPLNLPSRLFIFRQYLYKILTPLVKATYDLHLGRLIHAVSKSLNLWLPEVSLKEKQGKPDFSIIKAYPNGLAALIIHQLKKVNKINNRRKKAVSSYLKHLPKSILPVNFRPVNLHLIRFPILVDHREHLLASLKKEKIIAGTWYDQVVAPKNVSLITMRYVAGSCPKAENLCKKIVNLPTNITTQQINKIIKQVKLNFK